MRFVAVEVSLKIKKSLVFATVAPGAIWKLPLLKYNPSLPPPLIAIGPAMTNVPPDDAPVQCDVAFNGTVIGAVMVTVPEVSALALTPPAPRASVPPEFAAITSPAELPPKVIPWALSDIVSVAVVAVELNKAVLAVREFHVGPPPFQLRVFSQVPSPLPLVQVNVCAKAAWAPKATIKPTATIKPANN